MRALTGKWEAVKITLWALAGKDSQFSILF